MVKYNVLRKSVFIEYARILCVISSFQFSLTIGYEHGRYCMKAGVPFRSRIGVKLLNQPHLKPSFFPGLAHSGSLKAFAVIYKPARNGPSIGRILSQDQHNTTLISYQYVSSRKRISKRVHFSSVAFGRLDLKVHVFFGYNGGYSVLVDKLFIRILKQNDKTVESFDDSL